MNPLAKELNSVLQGSVCYDLLSDFGKRFYFPKGIAAQSAEANEHANRLNATIGMAFANGQPMMTKALRKHLQGLTPSEAVAYAPNAGDKALRKVWKEEILRKNPGVDSDCISTPTVVSGLTNGIAQLADLFVDPGEPVVIPDMFWGNYRLIFEERKSAKIVPFPFFLPTGGLNVDGFGEAIRGSAENGSVVLVVNFPNNPTGYSPTIAEAEKLRNLLGRLAEEGLRIFVIIDDAYFGLFYEEDSYKQSLFADLSSLHKNILAAKIDGPTKEDFVWGFRLGFVTFGSRGMNKDQLKAMEQKLLGAIRSSISNCSRSAQSLLLKVMLEPGYQEEKDAFIGELKDRYHAVREFLRAKGEHEVLKPLPFNSGYFMTFELKQGSSEELRTELLRGRGVGTIALKDKFLRVAYSQVERSSISSLYEEVYKAAEKLVD